MSDSMRTSDYYKSDLARCARDWAGSKTWPVPDTLRERLLQMADAIEELTKARAAAPVGASLREAAQWAEEQLSALVTEDDGNGAFVRHKGVELAGFGVGMKRLREALASSPTPPPAPQSAPKETR